MEGESLKEDTKLEINPKETTAATATSGEVSVGGQSTEADLQNYYKTPFFKTRARRRRSDTWITSVFVIAYIVVFVLTLIVNDCPDKSHGDCLSVFQPLSENPFLGPSASTLDKMGAIRRPLLAEHQHWRLLSCPWLHAGLIHLIINLTTIIFMGFYLEQEFGPLRIAMIFVLSALLGTLLAAFFARDVPTIGSSSTLFGLLGATMSALLRNWRLYSNKIAALLILLFVFVCNFVLGLLPYIDNFANIGGFISGFLLGSALFSAPKPGMVSGSKLGLYEYNDKRSFSLKLNLDKLEKPLLRSACLLLIILLFAGLLIAVFLGVNVGQYCSWCRYVDCIPTKSWSCDDLTSSCETMLGEKEMTVTCLENGNFRVFPFIDNSQERVRDLCSMICA